MKNITYESKNIRIEKVLILVPGAAMDEGDSGVDIRYQGYAKLPIPYTFGLLTKAVKVGLPQPTEARAVLEAGITRFKMVYKQPITVAEKDVDSPTCPNVAGFNINMDASTAAALNKAIEQTFDEVQQIRKNQVT